MGREQLPINLGILRWAREDAGLSLTEAAERARIPTLQSRGETPGASPTDRLRAWEKGEQGMTLRQLQSLAKAYRRPLLTFFLSAPPMKVRTATDFRTLGDRTVKSESPELAALLRRIETLHEDLVGLVHEEGGEPVPFVGALVSAPSIPVAATMIRDTLGFSFKQQLKLRSDEDVLRVLRRLVHDIGVFTLFEGNLGSHHTNISPAEFRGLALCHKLAPLIVVNPNDAKAARLFTLVHELTHIGLGHSSISNLDFWNLSSFAAHNEKERYCNAVAAEFLVPEQAIMERVEGRLLADSALEVAKLARCFKVSRMVIARRLMELGRIGSEDYRALCAMYKMDWEKSRQMQDAGAGPGRSILDKVRLGEKFIVTVLSAANEGRITLQDASRMLRVKASRFDTIV